MTYAELKRRLENLYIDLRCSNEGLIGSLLKYNSTLKEREEIIRQLYDFQYIELKCSHLTDIGSSADKANSDQEYKRMEKYISGFDDYLKKEETKIDNMIENNRIANKILKHILALDIDYSNVLYYKYVKRYTDSEIRSALYIARSTFYRRLKKSRYLLLDLYNDDEA